MIFLVRNKPENVRAVRDLHGWVKSVTREEAVRPWRRYNQFEDNLIAAHLDDLDSGEMSLEELSYLFTTLGLTRGVPSLRQRWKLLKRRWGL